MNLIDIICSRRSVRFFTKKEVEKEKMHLIIKCGLYAPSSKNSQPWRFTVIRDKKIIENIANILISSKNKNTEPSDPNTGLIKEGFNSTVEASGKIILQAPVLIVIENKCPFTGGRNNVIKSQFPDRATGGFESELISIGTAIENICLAVHLLDLGTVIISDVLTEKEKIKKILNLKGDLICILPVGYPSYNPPIKQVNIECVEYK